jgi:hypothetical protein
MLKIATVKPEVESDDTGTYPDGFFQRIDMEKPRDRRERSTYERDYSAARHFVRTAVGFA